MRRLERGRGATGRAAGQEPRVGAPRRRPRGIALVAVLWVLALIAILVAGFRAQTTTATRMASAALTQSRARALADGAVHTAIARLVEQIYLGRGAAGRSLPVDGTPVTFSLADGRISLAITDAGGLIDINAAEPPLLAGLLMRLGVPAGEAAVLAARIVDFRDLDDRPLPGGAEDPDYAAAGLPFGAKDSPFDSVDELPQVLGISFSLAARMKPYVTVMNGLPQIDPLVAPPLVLEAVPGLTPAARSILLGLRAGSRGVFRRAARPVDNPYFGASTRSSYRILATAHLRGGGAFTRTAVVQIRGSGAPPYFLRRWSTELRPSSTP